MEAYATLWVGKRKYVVERGTSFTNMASYYKTKMNIKPKELLAKNNKNDDISVLDSDLASKVFWKKFEEGFEYDIEAEVDVEEPKREKSPKKKKMPSEEAIAFAGKNGLEYIGGNRFRCAVCGDELTFHCNSVIETHLNTDKHKNALDNALIDFLGMFTFVDDKPSKKGGKRVRTRKSIRSLHVDFTGYLTERNIKGCLAFKTFRGLLKLNDVSFQRVDGFFCLCPFCDTNKYPGYEKGHRKIIEAAKNAYQMDIHNPDTLTITVDYALSIRSKKEKSTTSDWFSYDKWTLFNITATEMNGDEPIRTYFDVFVYEDHEDKVKLKHNSELTMLIFDKILSNDFFKERKKKTLSIWNDNGRNIKGFKTIHYLLSLIKPHFDAQLFRTLSWEK